MITIILCNGRIRKKVSVHAGTVLFVGAKIVYIENYSI